MVRHPRPVARRAERRVPARRRAKRQPRGNSGERRPHRSPRKRPRHLPERRARRAQRLELVLPRIRLGDEHRHEPDREDGEENERHPRRLADQVRAVRQRPVRDLVPRVQPHRRLHRVAQPSRNLRLDQPPGREHAVAREEAGLVFHPEMGHRRRHRRLGHVGARVDLAHRVQGAERRPVRHRRGAVEPAHESAARHHVPVEIHHPGDRETELARGRAAAAGRHDLQLVADM